MNVHEVNPGVAPQRKPPSAHYLERKTVLEPDYWEFTTNRPLVTRSLISSVLIMFSTTCRIIVFACVLERAADLPMRPSSRTMHLFDSASPSSLSLRPCSGHSLNLGTLMRRFHSSPL